MTNQPTTDKTKKGCCTPGRETGAPTTDAPDFERVPTCESRTEGMVLLSGGPFLMGDDSGAGYAADGEGPVREIVLTPFYIDIHAVTNAQFAEFIEASQYRTEAERFGWSFVFEGLLNERQRRRFGQRVAEAPWWRKVREACWRHPEGIGSSIRHRMDHPVTHVSWTDAAAYCQWARKRLPTEAEYEYAARGGLIGRQFAWGDDLTPGGEHRCNIWQGKFPDENTNEDGHFGTSPWQTYKPNGFGLYDMAGNVWEWCYDWWSVDYHLDGPRRDPIGPPAGDRKVTRGGSHLCHHSYCHRYRVAARTGNTPDSSSGNTGFRCVADRETVDGR